MQDALYGCVFCIQAGRTQDENDATVFFSQDQLFAHLARHPRPLPSVSGVTVIEGAEIPSTLNNNYDLQFTDPPSKSVMHSDRLIRQLALLPTATAIETVRPGQGTYRVSPDKSTTLHFAIGAKIVGVEFPDHFGGRWATGWADQVHGSFPVDCVKLDGPPPNEIRSYADDRSTYKAVVRWNFKQKEKDRGEWLDLKKGDAISNISCKHRQMKAPGLCPNEESWIPDINVPTGAYPGHWCWSGTNPKGKWGIFPRSHIEPGSERESGSDRPSLISTEGRSSGGMLSRVSLRRGGSRGSGGGTSPTSSRPLIY